MKELTQKVVILNNFSSPYVSQAIIVLKDYNPKLEGRAIADAEMIVSNYIERIEKKGQSIRTARKTSKASKFFKFVIGSAICTAIFFAVRYLLI